MLSSCRAILLHIRKKGGAHPMLPDLCVLALAFILLVRLRRKKVPRSRFLLSCLLYFYFSGVLSLTLLPILSKLPHVTDHTFAFNVRPFRDLLHGWGDSVGQILLNILLFLPFGILMPHRTGKGFFPTLLQAAICSAAIELLQPFFDRTCDITDFITNVVGCAWGYLVGLPLRQPLRQLGKWLDH